MTRYVKTWLPDSRVHHRSRQSVAFIATYDRSGYQSTRTLYQLVPSQFVPKSTAGPSQLKYSGTAVPIGNLFKSNNRNTETLTLTLSNAGGSDIGTS